MVRWIAGIAALIATTPFVLAQSPAPPQRLPFRPIGSRSEPTTAPVSAAPIQFRESLTEFDASTVAVKGESGQWQLWAGGRMIKDFGRSEADARMALLQFRTLKLNARGTVGGDFEYYLSDGAAPSAPLRSKLVVPFDAGTLRVEHANGQWFLRDAHATLFGFGESESDARQALAICRKYGFNQIAIIGQPVPAMKYLLRDPNPPALFGSRQPIVAASAPSPVSEAPARPLFVRGSGTLGTLTAVDHRTLRLRRETAGWTVLHGSTPIASFGPNEHDANAAVQLLRDFRCTDLCRFGNAEFGFFLSNGRAPAGSFIGVSTRTFQRERLQVRSVNGVWSIFENARAVFSFGADDTAARNALIAIRHFQFDTYVPIGNGPFGRLYLMSKTQ